MLSINQNSHIKVIENGIEFYSVEGLDEVKKEMLRLLNIINDIAIENHIDYWIDGGSLIGVLRHDGFIPWDDDLDISMLKKDYHVLVDKLTEYTKGHTDAFLFYSAPQNEHTCNFFASKSLFSRTQGSALAVPVKVDIRPVNCIEDSDSSVAENMKLRDTANYLIFGKSYGYVNQFPESDNQIHAFFDNYNNNYGFNDPSMQNALLVHPYFEFSTNFKLLYKDLFPLKKHKFENIEVPIPNNYDYLQTSLYGNYMEMPSLEHRAPVACKVYKKQLSSNFYYNYIKNIFGHRRKKLFQKLINNIYMMRIIGPFDYLKSKFYE